MFEELTNDLLDLTVSVKGRTAGRFAALILCCSCSCCCRWGEGDGEE
jgi:hypothetical protein